MKPLVKTTVLVIVCVLIVSGVYFFTKRVESVKDTDQTIDVPEGKPVFTWSYSSFEKNEIPRTTISLSARYENGFVVTKMIDTIEGGCNEYQERDVDVYAGSSVIICYYAGLGRYFKVVENGSIYEVKRKEFEEASPDYNPPVRTFETIATF